MAVDSYESTTGRPIFSDSGAPDIGVDPTAVGIYAADVGNRIIRSNLAALNAYAYKRPGLVGHALDTRTDYIHNGTGFVRTIEDTGWVALPLSPGSGWVNFGGAYGATRYRRINGVVYVTGMVKSGTTAPGQTIGTLPIGFRPAAYIMRSVAASNASGVAQVDVTATGQILHGSGVSAVFTALEFSFPAEQ
ncbi:hypothetical protein [Microbacterium sp. K5D]|uniref:hypothetical protein n=1 Tax=Microbacterium sp. K5D TaxID=2305436 RepID=UPI00109C5703|nr:hypothetical protein [Microbacterium sp. K5D]